MDKKTYDVWLVPNGRRLEFVEYGYTGAGWPDACRQWGYRLDLDDVRELYRELAEENYRENRGCDGGEWDEWFDAAYVAPADPDDDEAEEAARTVAENAADARLEKKISEMMASEDPTEWSSFEWHDDLKYVHVVEHKSLGTLYVCDKQGNNSEPLNEDELYTREEALTCELGGDPDVTLRETTADDGVAPSVDFVAVNGEGEIVGYYKFEAAY